MCWGCGSFIFCHLLCLESFTIILSYYVIIVVVVGTHVCMYVCMYVVLFLPDECRVHFVVHGVHGVQSPLLDLRGPCQVHVTFSIKTIVKVCGFINNPVLLSLWNKRSRQSNTPLSTSMVVLAKTKLWKHVIYALKNNLYLFLLLDQYIIPTCSQTSDKCMLHYCNETKLTTAAGLVQNAS